MAYADSIYALGTALGVAGIAVLRLSGPHTKAALRAMLPEGLPAPREAALRSIVDPRDGALLDRGLALWFPAPRSYTGEDMAEFHLHGGSAVIEGVLSALGSLEGLRVAEAGDFTRRAFENGKVDLTQVEALSDLMEAETQAQRSQALRQMLGAQGRIYEGWRERLLTLLAGLEAALEFPEEDDVVALGSDGSGFGGDLRLLRREMEAHLADGGRGERVREGLRVALVGPPNVGKSTLLNALCGRDAAIVTELAGTTTDVIEARVNISGFAVTLLDMAGLRGRASGLVEGEGMRRAEAAARGADIRIFIFTPERMGDWGRFLDMGRVGDLWVWSRRDLGGALPKGSRGLRLSARTGEGMDFLMERLAAACRRQMGDAPRGEGIFLTRARHREALEDAVGALRRAEGVGGELAAEDVRLAARALGRITGRVDVEDLLERLFAEFCIGK